jgi:hypothetical protein
MRLAFSILHNAEHHLKHNAWGMKLASMVDYWAVAVGACKNGGSTSWCKDMPDEYHIEGLPIDGTVNKLMSINSYSGNVRIMVKSGRLYSGHPYMWESKDQQVNAALDIFKMDKLKMYNYSDGNSIPNEINKRRVKEHIFLWQIDADEQWTEDQMAEAERMLIEQKADTGMFYADYWVSKELRAIGEWGEGLKLPYRRLWKWNGQYFKIHEPPVLDRGNGKEILLPQRFQHYAYYFDQDVRFKSDWYKGHEEIYEKWQALNKEAENAKIGTEWSVNRLISGPWGKTDTIIKKVK